ncbi:MAG TPA: glutamine--fructose-6-phosphate transaminase (isomerizing), partial [Dehalococcoidia bacterium]|nr:glutamine--fructose-6-phosphate transaminase (isomerizing) [Dehalococcoidia bacterium]
KLSALAERLEGDWPAGNTGIGHTRWATHGKPSDINAHPHMDCPGEIVVIHNGIVENHQELKKRLASEGHRFVSETDTEVIPHLIEGYLGKGLSLRDAVRETIRLLQGAHAIVVMSKREPDRLIAARVGNAGGVVVGFGNGEKLVASDLPALLPHTREVIFLADQELAELSANGIAILDSAGQELKKKTVSLSYDPISAAKGSYKHFMLKEMMEQPEVILDSIRGRVDFEADTVSLDHIGLSRQQLRSFSRVVLLGMGTSLHAAMVGQRYFERIARIPAEVDNASEFRYRDAVLRAETLLVAVTQSGETVDTLAAMEEARAKGVPQIVVCNVEGSQASRLAEGVVYTRCGLEIGVCSTKTFTASLIALYLLACYLGKERGTLSAARARELIRPLARVPYLIGEVTKASGEYERLAHQFSRYNNFLYLGRGLQYPIALEGALKLKEVSYIHAEGYPAGEMKHGPIALIDSDMPVVALAPRDDLYDKMMSNIEQVKAREGLVIAIGNEGDKELARKADQVIYLPETSPLLAPVFTVIPLQFFAYYIALRRGCDVDQPRNLAKTVTVE